jgi:hypothetical protein
MVTLNHTVPFRHASLDHLLSQVYPYIPKYIYNGHYYDKEKNPS